MRGYSACLGIFHMLYLGSLPILCPDILLCLTRQLVKQDDICHTFSVSLLSGVLPPPGAAYSQKSAGEVETLGSLKQLFQGFSWESEHAMLLFKSNIQAE